MTQHINNYIDRLVAAFPADPLPGNRIEDLTDSYGEDVQRDLAPFVGRKWNNLTPALIQRAFESVFWFTPLAFRYYLPGVMKLSMEEDPASKPRPTRMFIDNLIRLMAFVEDPVRNERRRNLWSQFNSEQLDVVILWLEWLQGCEADDEDRELIRSAIEYLRAKPV